MVLVLALHFVFEFLQTLINSKRYLKKTLHNFNKSNTQKSNKYVGVNSCICYLGLG